MVDVTAKSHTCALDVKYGEIAQPWQGYSLCGSLPIT